MIIPIITHFSTILLDFFSHLFLQWFLKIYILNDAYFRTGLINEIEIINITMKFETFFSVLFLNYDTNIYSYKL